MIDEDVLFGRAVTTFVEDLTGFKPSDELCALFARMVFAEAEEQDKPCLFTLERS